MSLEILVADLVALASVIVIDLVLAGDNAVVIGMAASRLDQSLRAKAITIGIALAIIFRVIFTAFAIHLLAIAGILIIGGVLLLWVSWKMWQDIRSGHFHEAEHGGELQLVAAVGFWSAISRIAVADISMSLDNVLAVAGAARHNIYIMALGLFLSIALMGIAATIISRVLTKYPWLNYFGLAVLLFVSVSMIWEGVYDVFLATGRTA